MAYCSNCGASLPDDQARYCPRCGAPVLTASAKRLENQKTFSVGGKPKLEVKVRTPGSISVTSGIDGQVTVDAEITEDGNIEYRAFQEANLISVWSRTKTWDPLLWGSYVFSGGPRTNIRIVTPRDADLDLETVTDPISVNGVSGTISLETKTSNIHLKDCSGKIAVRTHTGSIDLENVNGLIDLSDTIGTVYYSGSLAAGSSAVRTTTGDINVALKGQQDLFIDANTVVGHIISRVDLTESKYDRGQYVGQHISGKLGSGRGRLTLDATTGSITLQPI
ncbi:MAG TPA: DUF4097 family beta strand repeat-containing protein [Nitrososphaerales archaeon]|nr:DUF4097 family beta strand repeat-containing protein [Nitrososphaerales archaeon]